MMIRSGRLAGLACALFALSLVSIAQPVAAPLASQLGPEVAIAEPRDGFVGRLNVTPENGPVGTPLTVTADRLPPNAEFQLIWRTVKGNWKIANAEYHGREYKQVAYEIAKVRSDRDGRLTVKFATPEDFGFVHDIVLQKPEPDRPRWAIPFTITAEAPVLPVPAVEQAQKTVRMLPPRGELVTTPAFSGIQEAVVVRGDGFEPGKTYALNWTRVVGNRMTGAGWDVSSDVVAEAKA